MSITVFSGNCGTGKSLHSVAEIYTTLKRGKRNVICNFPLIEEAFNRKSFITGKIVKTKILDKFHYVENANLNVRNLVMFAFKNHLKDRGKENQTLLVIDEAQTIFNSRDYANPDRKLWLKFFQQHRHLGFEVILITQSVKSLDKQLRELVEYEYKHRKINNFGLGMFLPVKTFICIKVWYTAKIKDSIEFFIFSNKLKKMYDTFRMFDGVLEEDITSGLILPGQK